MKTDAELLTEAQALDAAYAGAEAFDAAQRNTVVVGFKVLWDNGNDCGELAGGPFDTEEDAIQYGEDWRQEMIALDDDLERAEEAYSFDVIEIIGEPTPSDEDLAAEEEAEWYAELARWGI